VSQKRAFVTGIGGLIGSSTAELLLAQGWDVSGVDANYRGAWFGPGGSVEWRMRELQAKGARVDKKDFRFETRMFEGADLVVHCASQPSHDFSRAKPVVDAQINYMGTVELLDRVSRFAPEAVFAFLSTNKVYGDRVNREAYKTEGERLVPRGGHIRRGIAEDYPMDASLHTPFGASKAAADLAVQEWRSTFEMQTVSFRCGCLTGKGGSAVELQGFLGYLVKCAVEGTPYTVYGHQGYQVRDNLDAEDLARAILLYAENPKAAVYNMGGGPENSLSVREAIAYLKDKHGCQFDVDYDGAERLGDHRYWVTATSKFEQDYPDWKPIKSVWRVLDEMVEAARPRSAA
jgi:CDP-paratose 2-epimerase